VEQSPFWEADSHSPSQKIPRILRNQNFITVFTRARHCNLSWATSINPVHYLTSYLFNIHYIIFTFALRSSKWSLCSGFWLKFCMHFSSTSYVPYSHTFHISWFDHHNYILWRVQSWSSWFCNFLRPPITSFPFIPNILPSTMFSNTPKSKFFPWCERPSSTPTQDSRYNCSFVRVYFNLLI